MRFVLCADTEDNHPNYNPGWEKIGSNYDQEKPGFRFDWLDGFETLLALLNENRVKVTWMLRTDVCIKDEALKQFKPMLDRMRENGQLGIHIHTLTFDGKIWRQSLDSQEQKQIIDESIRVFKETIGFRPAVSRMGWNAMSNPIMAALDRNGIKIDATGLPGYFSEGLYGKRDNIFDWTGTPKRPYHPSAADHKKEGRLKIIECPISVLNEQSLFFSRSSPLRKLTQSRIAVRFGLAANRLLNVNPHSAFFLSPNWDISHIHKIASSREELLVGYFHPSDILDPKTMSLNKRYLDNFGKMLDLLQTAGYESIVLGDIK